MQNKINLSRNGKVYGNAFILNEHVPYTLNSETIVMLDALSQKLANLGDKAFPKVHEDNAKDQSYIVIEPLVMANLVNDGIIKFEGSHNMNSFYTFSNYILLGVKDDRYVILDRYTYTVNGVKIDNLSPLREICWRGVPSYSIREQVKCGMSNKELNKCMYLFNDAQTICLSRVLVMLAVNGEFTKASTAKIKSMVKLDTNFECHHYSYVWDNRGRYSHYMNKDDHDDKSAKSHLGGVYIRSYADFNMFLKFLRDSETFAMCSITPEIVEKAKPLAKKAAKEGKISVFQIMAWNE